MRRRQTALIRICSAVGVVSLLFHRFVPCAVAVDDTTRLNTDNYKERTNARTVLLLLWDRNCPVCKEVLRPVWRELAEEWASHPIGLVGDINCSHPRGKVICERFNIDTVPTILYGDPLAPQEYTGGYDYGSLSTFAKAKLGQPVCHPKYVDACDDDTKSLIAQLRSKSKDQLIMETAAIEAQLEAVWAHTFSMNDYNRNVTITERESNYNWMMQILVEDHSMPIDESPFIWAEDNDEPDDYLESEDEADAEYDDEFFDEDAADGDDSLADDEFFDDGDAEDFGDHDDYDNEDSVEAIEEL
jgi:hypothetical protein